ncbi:type II toxin-antitoxin system RelE/ParE family toxin [Amaricoccus sp.]|uniref:type II toxin-antitoxin system RelE/ParE family toxin n=1 Tax=Amaricoccus sp. TaxID=1872485 RepID=UPI0026142D4B|nr:type II toxin-antitoxin system RelE/ParE family toxin [uncultured Amaricoccus sp.]
MSKGLRVRPAARDDIQAVAAHYLADSGPGIALAFTDQLQRALVRIAVGAEPGSAWLAQALDLPGLRAWRVARFPHLVLAIERPDHFDLLRVLHAKRDLPNAFDGSQ